MRTSKLAKRIFALVTLAAMLLATDRLVGGALERIAPTKVIDDELAELERQGEKIDLIFVGASRVWFTYAPAIFEEEMGLRRAFNAGSNSQPLTGSYHYIHELIERFHPSYIVLGAVANPFLIRKDIRGLTLINKLSAKERALYSPEFDSIFDRFTLAIQSYRYRYQVRRLVQNAEDVGELFDAEDYLEHRFYYGEGSMEDGNIPFSSLKFDPEMFSTQVVPVLDKIVDLCKENGVRLFLTTGPTTLSRIYGTPNYAEATEFLEAYARSRGLIYHNLNYLRNREEFLPDSKMIDHNHVNGEGATIISRRYAEILRKDIAGEDTSDYFYANLDELKASVHRIVSVKAKISIQDGAANIQMDSRHNEDVAPQYQVLLSTDGIHYETVMDWSQEDHCTLDVRGMTSKYRIQVRARTGEPGEIEAFQNYDFS